MWQRICHKMDCVPHCWGNGKRRATGGANKNDEKRVCVESSQPSSSIVLRRVLEDLARNEARAAPSIDQSKLSFETDLMYDSVPFARSLESLDGLPKHDVPLVARAYEERYMRECLNDKEEACVMGPLCECMQLDSANQFVGVQFTLPGDTDRTTGLCVLCLRRITQILFYHTVQSGHRVGQHIQRYGNICGQPGEYHVSAMLVCPPNGPVESMPLPIVAHQRNRYSVKLVGGVRYVRQHDVMFEDF